MTLHSSSIAGPQPRAACLRLAQDRLSLTAATSTPGPNPQQARHPSLDSAEDRVFGHTLECNERYGKECCGYADGGAPLALPMHSSNARIVTRRAYGFRFFDNRFSNFLRFSGEVIAAHALHTATFALSQGKSGQARDSSRCISRDKANQDDR